MLQGSNHLKIAYQSEAVLMAKFMSKVKNSKLVSMVDCWIPASNWDRDLIFGSYERYLKALHGPHNFIARQAFPQQPVTNFSSVATTLAMGCISAYNWNRVLFFFHSHERSLNALHRSHNFVARQALPWQPITNITSIATTQAIGCISA